jgi:hypothetical protein
MATIRRRWRANVKFLTIGNAFQARYHVQICGLFFERCRYRATQARQPWTKILFSVLGGEQ